MSRIVTFGEIMLKLSAGGYQRLEQTNHLEIEFTGAEANVAVSLSRFGTDVCFVTKLPKNVWGESAVSRLRQYGVCVSHILRGGERIGIYFSEKGASQRPSKVLYDRKHSSISEAHPEDFDWTMIFGDTQWFHFSGITPALSQTVAAICEQACKEAKKRGITISCDLNYRSKLWSSEEARRVMTKLCKYVDVCIANESDSMDVFGMPSEKLKDVFSFKYVCVTQRESYSASYNGWSAIMYSDSGTFYSPKYDIHIIDRIGGGDSFAAGLIYGLTNGWEDQHTLNFAVAASCLKQTIEGDFNLVTVSEVEELMNGNTSGRIKR